MRRRLRLLSAPVTLVLTGGMLLAPSGSARPGSAAAAPPPTGEVGGAGDAVGRWERRLPRCRLERWMPGNDAASRDGRLGCQGVRVDQQLPGLLSLRFLGVSAASGDGGAGPLVFAGVLEPGSRPLSCRQLRCRPRGGFRMQVSALADGGLRPDPQRTSLLRAQQAEGRCGLERKRLWCRVRGADGEEWEVEAAL